MKGTESFKKVISDHLAGVAAADPMFAEKMASPKKNIDDCITYILNQVKASGCSGFADAEIFGMAMHYYDEENVRPGAKINCDVTVNHKIELTEEEKAEAREQARKQLEESTLKGLQQARERKEAKEKKKQEKLKAAEAERKAKRIEAEKRMAMAQQTLF
jgi:Txe/YoeB family toxin of Txe-Axe toxin-antitoxin module